MKKFCFPLDRVMEWRRTQARIEESKLERLYAELRAGWMRGWLRCTKSGCIRRDAAGGIVEFWRRTGGFGHVSAIYGCRAGAACGQTYGVCAANCGADAVGRCKTAGCPVARKLKEQRLQTWRARLSRRSTRRRRGRKVRSLNTVKRKNLFRDRFVLAHKKWNAAPPRYSAVPAG